MKVGDLVRHANDSSYEGVGIVVQTVWVMYKVRWPDGSVLPHYPHNLEVISESR